MSCCKLIVSTFIFCPRRNASAATRFLMSASLSCSAPVSFDLPRSSSKARALSFHAAPFLTACRSASSAAFICLSWSVRKSVSAAASPVTPKIMRPTGPISNLKPAAIAGRIAATAERASNSPPNAATPATTVMMVCFVLSDNPRHHSIAPFSAFCTVSNAFD